MEDKIVEFCYSSHTPEGYKYRVILWTDPQILEYGYWYVQNTKTGQFRKIGRMGATRTNYFDVAIQFCEDHKNG